jgi:phosphoenolpyruvate phosphomutase
MMNKAKKFRLMLTSGELEFLMEAHNGLSARIVEQTGFKGIWASGLSISAALGVRDNNEASWTQVLEVCEFISDATSIPILLDGDTGYGNFNNVRRLVQKLEQREIAAVCIEDKLFPKTNSFIKGEQQALADIDEFAGKIKAAKDQQRSDDFSVVARLEAFIAGWGLDEALRRADAYYRAGADALLIHSKLTRPDQILAFAKEWQNACPLIIVPTTYYSTPVEEFEKAGISLVVWANHNVRSCITAMTSTCKQIFEERSLCAVEDAIAPVKEVFRLQNASELADAEQRYLPVRAEPARAIILAAVQGTPFQELTKEIPKSMINVGGRPLLHRMVSLFRQEDIKDITVIRGFGKENVHADTVEFVDNDQFESTRELYTLDRAYSQLNGETVIALGDIVFRKYILQMLLDAPEDISIAVDSSWRQRPSFNGQEDLVTVTSSSSTSGVERKHQLKRMDPSLKHDSVDGEWIGLMHATAAGTEAIKKAIDQLRKTPEFPNMQMFDLFNHLVKTGITVVVHFIVGNWVDVDNLTDLAAAERLNF